MLKAQLKSKISQLDSGWRGIEDILTGDFFGTLDYLPREPYLCDFISRISDLNPDVQTPSLENVSWEKTEIMFWPKKLSGEENAEPDIVIVSDKWVLVVEVKLGSGFGDNQPWREYVVGREMAQEHSISEDSVYYLVLARMHLDIASTFNAAEAKELNKLKAVTSYLKWYEAVALIEAWSRKASAEQKRMLDDLFKAMRKRRAIAFSGFKFSNVESVTTAADGIFCPPRFVGFLSEIPETSQIDGSLFFQQGYGGFLESCPVVKTPGQSIFLSNSFCGFGSNFPKVTQTYDNMFFATSTTFLNSAPVCHKYNNVFLKGLKNEHH